MIRCDFSVQKFSNVMKKSTYLSTDATLRLLMFIELLDATALLFSGTTATKAY